MKDRGKIITKQDCFPQQFPESRDLYRTLSNITLECPARGKQLDIIKEPEIYGI